MEKKGGKDNILYKIVEKIKDKLNMLEELKFLQQEVGNHRDKTC